MAVVRDDDVQVEAHPEGALVTTHSRYTGALNSMVIRLPLSAVLRWYAGESEGLVQQVFPDATADEREFLHSGCTPAEWDSIHGPEEDLDAAVDAGVASP